MAAVLAAASYSRGGFSLCLASSARHFMVTGASTFHPEPRTICTSSRGAIMVLGTTTVSDAAVVSGSIGVRGPVSTRAVSRSAMVGAVTSWTVSHSGLTSTNLGRIPRRAYWEKAGTFLSSGVEFVKKGVTHCTPQRTRMCGSGVARQMRMKGRSDSDNVMSNSNRDLGDVPCLSSRR